MNLAEEDVFWGNLMYNSCMKLASEDFVCTNVVWSSYQKKCTKCWRRSGVTWWWWCDGWKKKMFSPSWRILSWGQNSPQPPLSTVVPSQGCPLVFKVSPVPLFGQLGVPWPHRQSTCAFARIRRPSSWSIPGADLWSESSLPIKAAEFEEC